MLTKGHEHDVGAQYAAPSSEPFVSFVAFVVNTSFSSLFAASPCWDLSG
jgi:hypothetical protein